VETHAPDLVTVRRGGIRGTPYPTKPDTTGRMADSDKRQLSSRTVASTVVFTAFVAAVTMAFAIYIPATKGYFDIGEIMVYTTALLMGPYVGAFAGGVGSSISDAILAPQYAPGTLVIKGLEGLIVGYLAKSPMTKISRRAWRATSAFIAVGLGAFIGWVGVSFLSGPQTLYLGFSSGPTTPIGPQFSANFNVPYTLWIVIGALVFLLVFSAGVSVDPRLGWTVVSILAGGTEMVLGYFLFESLALQLGVVTASVEVPVNVGQVLVGLIVSIPIVRSIRKVTAGRVTANVAGGALAAPSAS